MPVKQRTCADVSNWKFSKKDPPSSRQSPSEKGKADSIQNVLDRERTASFLRTLSSSLDLGCVEGVANILKVPMPDKTKVETATASDKMKRMKMLGLGENLRKVESDEHTATKDLNFYRTLQRHIEKVEKEKRKSDPEAAVYKLIEERLDKIAQEFCQWTSCIRLKQAGESDEEKPDEMVIEPDKLRKMFHIDICHPTLCPYIPFIIQEARELPHQIHEKRKSQKKVVTEEIPEAKRKKMQQAYYIPPTQWFTKQRKTVEVDFSVEEEDFVKSFGFKKFFQFLAEKGEEPPKILENLRKDYKERLKRYKEEEIHKKA